jgi:hypothetical protein
VVTVGLLGRRWGYWVGSALQVLVVVSGLILAVPAMLFLGVVFAGLWFLALHLGGKVERLKEQRAAEERDAGPG